MLLLLFRARLQLPLALKHQAIILWGGWLMTCVVFFSVAGFFHEYYLAIFAAPLAALVGIGAAELWSIHRKHPWLGVALLLPIGGGTLVYQIVSARTYVGDAWWLGIGVALFVVGVALLIVASRCRWQRVILTGFVMVFVALLIVPGIWSALTVLNSSGNTTIPTSYSGRAWGGPGGGRSDVNVDSALVNYLQAHTQGMKYMMAVSSAQQGDDYVLATGRGVLMLGGFGGRDRVATTADLEHMIANGELRYFYLGGGMGGGPGDQSNIPAWVTANCTPVQDLDTGTSGTSGTMNNRVPSFGPGGPGNMTGTLYDCGK